MNNTTKLLQCIGTPFSSGDRYLPSSKEEAVELYNFAKKNKIGLLFLTSLEGSELAQDSRLQDLYIKEKQKNCEQEKTLKRVSEIFNNHSINYAIFKSYMPFPATPNDVDIIHFGDNSDFEKLSAILSNSGYNEVFGMADTQQKMFHDVFLGGVLDPHPHVKDVYDVDVYNEISASFLIYLDKNKIKNHIIDLNLSGTHVKMLSPPAELLSIIIHSIIPEMICTLFVYYANLYYIHSMDEKEILEFISLSKENKLYHSISANFEIVSSLHYAAHGFIPAKLQFIMNNIKPVSCEASELKKTQFKTPHKYLIRTVLAILWEKNQESVFRKSFRYQLFKLMNPKMTYVLIRSFVIRRKRETY